MFGRSSDDEEEEEEDREDEWVNVPGGEAAPQTPPLGPIRQDDQKTREEGRSKDDEMWDEIFGGASDEKQIEDSMEKWKKTYEADDEEGEEGRKPKQAKSHPRVSKEEREEHECTHCPFRIGCRYCVEGRSHKLMHKSKKESGDTLDAIPRISMDYFYMSQKDEKAKEHPMIVAVDESTGDKFARATGQKGVEGCDWLIKEFAEELQTWGHAGGPGGKNYIEM